MTASLARESTANQRLCVILVPPYLFSGLPLCKCSVDILDMMQLSPQNSLAKEWIKSLEELAALSLMEQRVFLACVPTCCSN